MQQNVNRVRLFACSGDGRDLNSGRAAIPHGLKWPAFHKRRPKERARPKLFKIECDRIFLLKAGRIPIRGPSAEVGKTVVSVGGADGPIVLQPPHRETANRNSRDETLHETTSILGRRRSSSVRTVLLIFTI
jgi:hypothetical protein